jgi:hypothetical protein
MMKCEVEMQKVERPSHLSLIEFFGCAEVLEILMICPDLDLVMCAL